MAGPDTLLGFPNETHEVLHGREAVRADYITPWLCRRATSRRHTIQDW